MPRVARRGRVWTAKARQHWASIHTDWHPLSSLRGGPQTLVESHAFGLCTGMDAHIGCDLAVHVILLDGHVIRVGVHSKPSWRPTHIEWTPIARWIGRPHTLRGLPRLRIVDAHYVSSLTLWTSTHALWKSTCLEWRPTTTRWTTTRCRCAPRQHTWIATRTVWRPT